MIDRSVKRDRRERTRRKRGWRISGRSLVHVLNAIKRRSASVWRG